MACMPSSQAVLGKNRIKASGHISDGAPPPPIQPKGQAGEWDGVFTIIVGKKSTSSLTLLLSVGGGTHSPAGVLRLSTPCIDSNA